MVVGICQFGSKRKMHADTKPTFPIRKHFKHSPSTWKRKDCFSQMELNISVIIRLGFDFVAMQLIGFHSVGVLRDPYRIPLL